MGCDINGVLQHETEEDVWVTFAPIEDFFDNRNYELFGILAGVRCQDYELISDDRGFPEDFLVTDADHHHIQFPDGTTRTWMGEHNYGHLTFREFLDYNWHQRTWDNSMQLGTKWSELHKTVYQICSKYKLQPETIRMVFGFDS